LLMMAFLISLIFSFSRAFSEAFKSLPSLRIIINEKTSKTKMHKTIVPTIPGWVCHVFVSIPDSWAKEAEGNNKTIKMKERLLGFISDKFSIIPFYLFIKYPYFIFPVQMIGCFLKS